MRGLRPPHLDTSLTSPPLLPILPSTVTYVLADTFDKGKKASDGEAGASSSFFFLFSPRQSVP